MTNRIMSLGGNLEVAGVSIRTDAEGRYSLNDFHRAAGGEDRHKPGNWLQSQQTMALIAEIEIDGKPAISRSVGRNGGTFACKELIYAYAMWVSPTFHLKVIRTFDSVATGIASADGLQNLEAIKFFPSFYEIAVLIGCNKQAAAISANQAVLAVSGTNVLQLMGQTHITAANQESKYYTPTELGKRIGISGQKMNSMLASAGLQVKRDKEWDVLAAGQEFARIYDTGKKHGSGVPIQQIKWSAEVIPVLGKDAA